MKIIDSHMHVGLSGLGPDEIIRNMDLKEVEITWLLTWEELDPPVPLLYQPLSPEAVLEAVDRYPDRFRPFYAPDPASADLDRLLERYEKAGIRGCGELKISRKWDDPLVERYLEKVEQRGWALVFHMEEPRWQYIQEKEGKMEWLLERLLNDKYNGVSRYYLTKFAESTGILKRKIHRNRVRFPGILFDFDALEKQVRQFPGIRFIGHGPDFWNHISSEKHPRYLHQKGTIASFGIIDRLLEEYDNFYCDISGTSGFNALQRDKGQARSFLDKHFRKVLYGTDNTRFPLLKLLQSMRLAPEAMERILYRNAEEIC